MAEELVSRMPLAYVHLVHLLVEALLVATPFVLYPRLGLLSVPTGALLTHLCREESVGLCRVRCEEWLMNMDSTCALANHIW